MSCLCQPIDKAIALFCIFLKPKFVKVEAITGASDLLWLFTWIFEILCIPNHYTTRKFKECISNFKMVKKMLLLWVINTGMVEC